MKFPKAVRVSIVYGDQGEARRCYALTLKGKGNNH